MIDEEAILEIKNVDSLQFKDKWIEDDAGFLEAPPHIELQHQTQLLLSGKSKGYIGALVGGNKVQLIERAANQDIQFAIVRKVTEFWNSVDQNNPPPPNYKLDAASIIAMNQFADPGKTYDAKDSPTMSELAHAYKRLTDSIKDTEEERQAVKAQMLVVIGDAEKCHGDGWNLSASLIGPCQMNYERAGYRNFRVTWPKPKK
jgi:predicted phage-related endonuclease